MTRLAGILTLAQRGSPLVSDLSLNVESAKIASDVATVAAKAWETARATPGESHQYAMDAYGWALVVAKGNSALTQQLTSEFESLRRIATSERWTHSTCVAWRDGWVALPSKRRRWWPWI